MAKELGVQGSAIIKKCQDEGLDVKNHMSTISAGLAATIREWFSEGEHKTTEETSGKVDLEKVRVLVKRTKKKTEAEKETLEEVKADADTSQPVEAVLQDNTEQSIQKTETAATVVVEKEPEKKPEQKKTVVHPRKLPQKIKEPEVIMPAGPKLEKPAPAKLSGPEVVRIESPEPEESHLRIRPKPKKPRYDTPVTQPLIQDEIVDLKKGKGKAAKKGRDRTFGRRGDETEFEAEKRIKFETQRRQKDLEERQARLSAAGGEGLRIKPRRKIFSKMAGQQQSAVAPVVRPGQVIVNEPITVKGLAEALMVKVSEIVEKLMHQGIMATANHIIGTDVAELIAIDLGTELKVQHKKTIEEEIKQAFESRERKNPKKRPVVVTILGHVDHGKTSLLDKIRSTHVAAGEAGGITQHIGAYQIEHRDSRITFLDTPGHEAFTEMRARGANMTDVVVLVVAANDGVMPQTIEAIHHAKAAGVPIIVALNKTDLPGCDFNRIYSQLSEQGLAPTEWGGDTEVVKTSAVTGAGIDNLLEHLDYVSDLLELKADDTIPATGWVVEAKISPTQGSEATLLVKEGELKKGDIVLAGGAYGRVKTMLDSFGKNIKRATSSMPVVVTGLSSVPNAGDKFYCLDDVSKAKTAAESKQAIERESALATRTQITLDNLFSQIEKGNIKELNIIIKADVQGSVDVLTKYLTELSTNEVKIKLLHAATGGITEGDVVLAEASNAIIIGFNVVSDERVAKIAEKKGVDIRLYTIIYRITEDLQKSMVGMLEPEKQEKNTGRAVIRNTFKVSKVGTIAGCYVNNGYVTKKAKVRLIRNNIVVRDDLTIESLKRFKDDVREVKEGMECGIKFAKFDDVKVDDILDFYEVVEVARVLS